MTDFSSLIATDMRTPEEKVADQMLADLADDARRIVEHYRQNYGAWWNNPAADFNPQLVAQRLGPRGGPAFALVNTVLGIFAPDEIKAIPSKWTYTVGDDGTLNLTLAILNGLGSSSSSSGGE